MATKDKPALSAYFNTKLFKEPVPLEILYNLLDQVAIKKSRFYIFDETCFRSLIHKPNIYQTFVKDVLPYYHTSKAFYITRTHDTINSFMTVVGQMCKHQGVQMDHKWMYKDGIKNHEYYIYF